MLDCLDLYDYRCRIAVLYQKRLEAFVAGEEAESIWRQFRRDKDQLFAHHSQSALDTSQRQHFQGLRYFPYNPALSFSVDLDTDVEPVRQSVAMNANEAMTMTTVGRVHFTVENTAVTLSIYWLDIYGGGLFLPFRDATCPGECYGGGRYLFDTIKGSTPLPTPGNENWRRMILDFNYAYNPSCAYNGRWVCPLAPLENRLPVAIRAGEMNYQ